MEIITCSCGCVCNVTQKFCGECGSLLKRVATKGICMKLENELCNVEILIDTTYTAQSADNKHYDVELNPENYKHNDFYKTLSIHIDLFFDEIDIALIGDYHSYDFDSAILDDDILTIMQNNSISQIRVTNAELILHKRFECFGCTFGLYRVPNGYVVYGELEIVGLNLNFDRVWGFCGRDIFVTESSKMPFELCENSIRLYDWEENYYELDYDGNLICDKYRMSI